MSAVSSVVALGSGHALDGFALAGASVVTAETEDEVLRAWEGLGDGVGLLILSSFAAQTLVQHLKQRPDLLTAEMP